MNEQIRIVFICHGNICRSPMGEYIMKHLVCEKFGVKTPEEAGFHIESMGVSSEELTHDIYPPAKRMLASKGVPFGAHRARRVAASDYEKFDYFLGASARHVRIMKSLFEGDKEGKVMLMREFVSGPMGKTDVSDPWYTGDFETAFEDIREGCEAFLAQVLEK